VAAAGFYGVAPDMRGYGGTDAPHDPAQYDHFKHLSGDVLALVEHVGHSTATLVGHDWGGAVVWNLAAMRPDKFPRVCAMSVPRSLGAFTVSGLKKRFNWKEGADRADDFFYMLYHNEIDPKTGNLVAAQDYSRNPQKFFASIMGTSGDSKWQEEHTIPPKVNPMAPRAEGGFMDRMRTLKNPAVLAPWFSSADLEYYVTEFTAHGFAGGLNYYRCMDHTTASGRPYDQKPITQPALFIGGVRDMVTVMSGGQERIEKAMSKMVPNCEIHWLDCGHWIQNEEADKVNSLLVNFLRGAQAKL